MEFLSSKLEGLTWLLSAQKVSRPFNKSIKRPKGLLWFNEIIGEIKPRWPWFLLVNDTPTESGCIMELLTPSVVERFTFFWWAPTSFERASGPKTFSPLNIFYAEIDCPSNESGNACMWMPSGKQDLHQVGQCKTMIGVYEEDILISVFLCSQSFVKPQIYIVVSIWRYSRFQREIHTGLRTQLLG